ncbi:MAG: M14 family metallopeptidase [Candidatus Muirbacterium halophilum]|nr:M14 family metallopeptidase [Candidatus Muirbacterium halophilum]MCK9476992.1 M14 family metallopeptidase [Candidatus Muirbacterium halophilum]
MKKIVLFLFICCIFISGFSDGFSIVRIYFKDKDELNNIVNFGLEIENMEKNSFISILNDKDIDILKSKHKIEVLSNADSIFDSFRGRDIKSESVYHTYEECNKVIEELVKDYSDIAKKFVIGKSYEGREITGIKISDNVNEDEQEPSALFMGAHHAREWISIEVPIALAQYLLENYKTDQSIKNLVDQNEIFIIPIINPDGVEWSMKEYKYWRKTRRPIGTSFGVDPNRNYSYHWGETGASSSAWNDTFKGEKAFSENCTKALRDFALWRKFDVSISYHSYGEDILYPYSYSNTVNAPDHDYLKKISHAMAEKNGYNAIKSADLYPAAGDSDDWLYSELGTFAFTFELATSFIPYDTQVDGICMKNVDSAIVLLEKIPEILEYKKIK